MTISKPMLFAFGALMMVGAGAAMYVGVQLGLAAAQPDTSSAMTIEPVARTDLPTELCVEETATSDDGTNAEETSTGQSEQYSESGDYATNSGVISGSQFSDGGFGDIGQQWWNVDVGGDVITVNVGEGGSSVVDTGDHITGPLSSASALTNGTPLAASSPAPSAPQSSEPPAVEAPAPITTEEPKTVPPTTVQTTTAPQPVVAPPPATATPAEAPTTAGTPENVNAE